MSTDPAPRRPSSGTDRVTRSAVTVLAALVTGALLLGACGDDDTDDAGAASQQSGETTTSADAPGDTASPSTTLADPEPIVDQHPALVGTWAVPDSARTQTFTADGEHFVSQDGEVLAEGTWTSTSTTIEIVPGSGPIACAQAGTYEWEVENDTLTLTAVDDECPDRKAGLDGVPRERVE